MKIIKPILCIALSGVICACTPKAEIEVTNSPASPMQPAQVSTEELQKLVKQAFEELDQKNFNKAINISVQITKSDPEYTDAYLIDAQANSMLGNFGNAINALQQAFQHGFVNVDFLEKEPRLVGVRATQEYKKLLSKNGFSAPVEIKDKEINAGNVSIKEDGDNQTIKAGDLTIQIPKDH